MSTDELNNGVGVRCWAAAEQLLSCGCQGHTTAGRLRCHSSRHAITAAVLNLMNVWPCHSQLLQWLADKCNVTRTSSSASLPAVAHPLQQLLAVTDVMVRYIAKPP